MARPATLSRDISPPPRRKSSNFPRPIEVTHESPKLDPNDLSISETGPTLAAVEAGEAQIQDHLDYFAKHLQSAIRPASHPPISIDNFRTLYKRNQHKHGRHFVIHQHDHPISGVHYDLRLQFSGSSTVSFAIPYGLPGNPNSIRPLRMAVETRVHTLWNNLIESASHATGSLLIWDTGEYEVLPWREDDARVTDDELTDNETDGSFAGLSQSERLFFCFQRRRIRLRLNGAHLPPSYTISMWLPSANDRHNQLRPPKRRRSRRDPSSLAKHRSWSSSENDAEIKNEENSNENANASDADKHKETAAASGDDEDTTIRANNAYTGAQNTIGSIHQRNWLLKLDKKNSGFRKGRYGSERGRWVGEWEPFFVRGRDFERSSVTGRNADELMEDERVERFVGRKMWRPILE